MESCTQKFIYIRGDTKDIYFKIKKPDGSYIDGSEYSEVEVQINPQSKIASIKKLMSKGEVSWEMDRYFFNLSQEETFTTKAGVNVLQVRIYQNGECKATYIYDFLVGEVLSDEVINND